MDASLVGIFKHLSNFKKMEMINGINMKEWISKRLN